MIPKLSLLGQINDNVPLLHSPVPSEAQAVMRKMAREAEREAEDPDKYYKEIETEEDQVSGRGRRGRGGRGGRGRGRSGRGRATGKTKDGALPGGLPAEGAEVANPQETQEMKEDEDLQDAGGDVDKGSCGKLARSGSNRLFRKKSHKRWVLRKMNSRSTEILDVDSTPKKDAQLASHPVEGSDVEPKPKPKKQAPKKEPKPKQTNDWKAKHEAAKAIIIFAVLSQDLHVFGIMGTRDGDFHCPAYIVHAYMEWRGLIEVQHALVPVWYEFGLTQLCTSGGDTRTCRRRFQMWIRQ